MNFRLIPDPEGEVERLAALRKPREPLVTLAEGVLQIPEPGKPDEFFDVRVWIAANEHRPVRADILERLREAITAGVASP